MAPVAGAAMKTQFPIIDFLDISVHWPQDLKWLEMATN
jgi:hypothetical protein